jgi:hypothetical protein
MAEEHEPEQGRHVAHAEHLGDDARGQRHGGEPEQSHGGGEQVDGEVGLGRQQQRQDDRRAGEVDHREPVYFLLQRWPAAPAANEPMMLNRPTSESAIAPTPAARPRSTT